MNRRNAKISAYSFAALLLSATVALHCISQTINGSRYFYDSSGRLTIAIDLSGNEIDYTYDAVGNITQVTRKAAPASNALAILNFTPQSGPVGTIVTIQGQNFDTTAASNTVSFNGAAAAVTASTASSLTATVPSTATTGPISITVNGVTAASSDTFTVIPAPAISSVSPRYTVSSSSSTTIPNFAVTGMNLTNATFAFAPVFSPPGIVITSANIDPSGTSATLSLTVAAGIKGSFTLQATNTGGPSSPVGSAGNTFQVIDSDGDADGDGLTNAVETAIGTDPLNPQTSGAGLSDGWQVFYGLNPLSAGSAGPDPAGSGNTALQDFQQGFSPRIANRVPPSVTRVAPANSATGAYVNSRVVLTFGEALQEGTTLTAAQSAIASALASSSGVSPSSQAIAATTLQSYMNRTCCGNSVGTNVVTISGPYGAIPGSVTPASSGFNITFAPSPPFQANTSYTVQVKGVKDTAGNLMTTPFTSSFTTGSLYDQSTPQVLSTSPSNGAYGVPTTATIGVTFSNAIDPSTLTAANFSVTDSTTALALTGVTQLDAAGTTATFTPGQPLAANHFFSVAVTTGIQDLAGYALTSSLGFGFSTGLLTQEVDTPTFALLNGISPTPTSAMMREVDTQTFSLLNGVSPVPVTASQKELDTLTFSLLNGGVPSVGATVYEVDTVTFSVHNTATATASTSSPTPLAHPSDRSIMLAPNTPGSLVPAPSGVQAEPSESAASNRSSDVVSDSPRPLVSAIKSKRTTPLRPHHRLTQASRTQSISGRPALKTKVGAKKKAAASPPTSRSVAQAVPKADASRKSGF